MAEISLREYLEKVDTLLKTGKSDEVILHSRQILKHYPKNVAASRYLGQALVRGSDYKEAEPVLRRVLSVYPDDVIAHTGISDMNDRQGKGDEAIWHIERALEGTPNDGVLVEKWRGLYQRYRKVEDPRFQLTTGAVARQYTRNGLYAQAIETLQTTLEKSPRRVDLRLLLAQTMWNAGMQVEGAETALDVLDVLPYCLEANRILTLLWLSEGRPSDAQRYLNQIQDVEPYQALQLAQNTAPDDEAFTVPELDYRRIAESQINTDQPDWLTEIDEESPAPMPVMTDVDDEQDFDFETELPEAFLTDLEADDVPVVTRPKTGMTGLLAALEQPQGMADDEIADDLPVSGELPDWLLESAPQETALEALSMDEAGADPTTWLEDGGTELADDEPEAELDFEAVSEQAETPDWMEQPPEQNIPDFFGETDFSAAMTEGDEADDHDPLAWLEGSGVELIDEDEMPPTSSLIDEEEMVYSDPEQINPLAWLERSGVELVEEDDTLHTLFDAPTQPTASSDDPMAWLEAENPELFGEDSQTMLNLDAEEDSSDWLSKAGAADLPASGFLDALPQSSPDEDGLDWLNDDSLLEDVPASPEASDTGGLPVIGLDASDEDPAAPDFFADMDRVTDRLPGSLSAVSENEFTETGGQSEMSENEELEPQSDDSELSSFEWLNEEPEAEDSPEASASDLDWMTEVADEQAEWLNEENGEIESAAPTTGGPDWLVEESGSVTNEFGWLNEPGDEVEPISEVAGEGEALDWLSGGEDEEELAAEPGEMPDWLNAAAPVDEVEDDEQVEPAAEMAAMPDWLASAQPSDEDDEAEAESEIMGEAEAFDWLSSEDEPAAAVSEAPDWLSAIAPASEEDDEDEPADEMAEMTDWLASAQPSDEDDMDEPEAEILSEAEAFDWSEDQPEAQPIGETPDWLSAIAPDAMDEGEAEIESEIEASLDALEWEAEADEDEPAAELTAMPDWLASAQPSDEDDADEMEAEVMSESEAFDWSEDEPEAESVGETPDWLSALAPDAMDEGEAEIETSFEELESEAESAAELAEMPDWLASAQPSEEDDADEMEAEVMSESEAFDWSEDEPEAQPIGETPDWLSAIAPDAMDEGEAEIESEIEASLDALEWEAEADEDESAAELTAMPDWLASAQPSEEDDADEMEAEVMSESEAFDWSEDEPEAQPIGETPDWLSAIAPDAMDEGEAEIESEIEASLDALEWEAEADEDEPAAELTAMPDWLASAQPSDEDDADEMEAEVMSESEAFDWSEDEPEAESVGETPDWLSALAPASDEDVEVEAEIISEAEGFDWAEEEPEAESAGAMPDWLAEAEPEAALDEDKELDGMQYIPPAASVAQTRILPENDFGWEQDDDAAEAEPEYETDYEADPASSQFGWTSDEDESVEEFGEAAASLDMPEFEEGGMDFEEKVLASASTPPPADNAPDWLNAMVPGLDLDYQAIEDDRPIESDYIDIPARREQPETAETTQPGNFNWLVDIVDEETGPMRAIQDTPESTRSRSRFTFSRQPAWLRTLMSRRGRSDSESDDDFELPEWLR